MKENVVATEALKNGKHRLFIVDDDQELLDLMVNAFEADGRWDIRTANNGFGAGMLVKDFRPEMVVLDVMLPDINGKEVCQRVRNDPTMKSVRVICISGMVEQSKIDDLRLAGADDFMNKPFEVEDLIRRCCEMLEMEDQEAAAS